MVRSSFQANKAICREREPDNVFYSAVVTCSLIFLQLWTAVS